MRDVLNQEVDEQHGHKEDDSLQQASATGFPPAEARKAYLKVGKEERQIVVGDPANDDEQWYNKRSDLLEEFGKRMPRADDDS